jgi:hypothetical protein
MPAVLFLVRGLRRNEKEMAVSEERGCPISGLPLLWIRWQHKNPILPLCREERKLEIVAKNDKVCFEVDARLDLFSGHHLSKNLS